MSQNNDIDSLQYSLDNVEHLINENKKQMRVLTRTAWELAGLIQRLKDRSEDNDSE